MTNRFDVPLPQAAQRRLERARAAHVATSLLSVPSQVSLGACGFVPVGEVMGCYVLNLGFSGFGGCGLTWGSGLYSPARTVLSRQGGAYGGFKPYLDAVESGWYGALARLYAECAAIGGDGAVGVQLVERRLDGDVHEYVALGTAVRSLGTTRPPRPFSTALAGPDVAKLLWNGYVPTEIIVAVSVGVRHDDYMTVRATMLGAGNVEVPGYSELVQTVRDDARVELTRRVRESGSDGAVLSEPMRLGVHEVEVAEGHRDHVAIASLVASGLARFSAADNQGPVFAGVLSLRSLGSKGAR